MPRSDATSRCSRPLLTKHSTDIGKGAVGIRLALSGARIGCRLDGNFNQCIDILGAPPAASVLLETEFTFELAGGEAAGTPGFSHIRFGDALAQTDVHTVLLGTIMRSVLSMPVERSVVKRVF